MKPTEEHIRWAQEVLPKLTVQEELFTVDELEAVEIVRDAVAAISRGEDLSPTPEGQPLKKRLIRRIEVSFFHPNAARPKKVTAP